MYDINIYSIIKNIKQDCVVPFLKVIYVSIFSILFALFELLLMQLKKILCQAIHSSKLQIHKQYIFTVFK